MQDYAALRATFEQDGFIHIPALMSPEEMAELKVQLSQFIQEIVPTLPKSQVMYEDNDKSESLKYFGVPDAMSPYFAQLRARPKMIELAKMLLQDEVVPKPAQYFSKPPGLGKPTPPHQDGYYYSLVPNEALTIWLAVDDIDDKNGALYYVAGVKKGVLDHSASHIVGFSQGVSEGNITKFGTEVTCRVKSGDALVHHSLTIHAADGNPSSRQRRAIGLVYFAQRAKIDPELQRRYQESLLKQREEAGP